jgi:hypothetical protein
MGKTICNLILINLITENKKQSYPCNRPRRPIGLWDFEDLTFSRQYAHSKIEVVNFTRRQRFTPNEDYWYSFLL